MDHLCNVSKSFIVLCILHVQEKTHFLLCFWIRCLIRCCRTYLVFSNLMPQEHEIIHIKIFWTIVSELVFERCVRYCIQDYIHKIIHIKIYRTILSELCTILHTVLFLPCVILALSHVHTILSLSNSPDNDCGFFSKTWVKNLALFKIHPLTMSEIGVKKPRNKFFFIYNYSVFLNECVSQVFTDVSFLVVVELHSMSMRLVSSGGTYNVRASEMSSHLQDRQPKMVTCIVHFLDDSQTDFEVDVSVPLTPSFPVLPHFFCYIM